MIDEGQFSTHDCRFVNGFSVGLFSLLVPMYMSEIAPTSLRGLMGTCHAFGITVGITIAIALGLPIADNLEWWRYVAAMSTAPVIVLFIGFIFYIPESPRWLLTQGRVPHALDALKRLRGSTFDSDAEMRQLQRAQQESARQDGPSSVMQQLQMLSSPRYRRPMLIAFGLQLTQQLTGINGVLFYLGDLFSFASQTCNRDNVRTAIQYSVLGGSINVVGAMFSLFITEKAGRRLQLSLSLAGMGAFLAMGGCAIWFGWASAAQKVAVLFYIFFFAIGCGPVPWVMMSEVMPSRMRGLALSLGTLWNWLLCNPPSNHMIQKCFNLTFWCSAFIVVLITPTLATLGNSPTVQGPFAQFWMFAAVCAIGMHSSGPRPRCRLTRAAGAF
jgi:predicted MFS family arabinose efflux permease